MSVKSIKIANRYVGPDHDPFIIAEMSGNHNQSLERALEIVEAAAKSGAHALKIQTYTADTMTLDISENEFFIDNPDSLWKGTSLYKLYEQAHTPWEWHQPIFKKAQELGMIAFSTPFDASAVGFLEKLDVPCYKIASFENTDLQLIKCVAKTRKPLIISTGMATVAELDEAVRTAREEGCEDIILLKCSSAYPASPSGINLQTIPHMREMFQCQIGLSDHTMGYSVALGAVSVGATVIEKHFTLSRSDGGVDSAFSMEPHEMASLVSETKLVKQALGRVSYGASEEEKKSMIFRRSLYVVKDLKAGDILNSENLRAIRPGYGLPVKHYESLMGRRVSRDIKKGTPVSWEMFR